MLFSQIDGDHHGSRSIRVVPLRQRQEAEVLLLRSGRRNRKDSPHDRRRSAAGRVAARRADAGQPSRAGRRCWISRPRSSCRSTRSDAARQTVDEFVDRTPRSPPPMPARRCCWPNRAMRAAAVALVAAGAGAGRARHAAARVRGDRRRRRRAAGSRPRSGRPGASLAARRASRRRKTRARAKCWSA